jgi:hypothetical protein
MKARKSDPSSSSYSLRIVQIGNYGKFKDPVVEEPTARRAWAAAQAPNLHPPLILVLHNCFMIKFLWTFAHEGRTTGL